MTEAEWLACTDPTPMLEFLRGKASDRKLRLFSVACVYRILHLLPKEPHQQTIELAERHADGAATSEELAPFVDMPILKVLDYVPPRVPNPAKAAAYAVLGTVSPQFNCDGRSACRNAAIAFAWNAVGDAKSAAQAEKWAAAWNAAEATELQAQSDLLRCILGNPFRPVSINPAWLLWNDATIPKIAQAIYGGRTFDHMPFLAGALVEAGCADRAILDHCRGPGPHVRGCWVVDLILGKG